MTKQLTPVIIYCDGSCLGNPGPGGWCAILIKGDKQKTLKGGEKLTTNNRMELTAALQALKAIVSQSPIQIYTDSQYLRLGVLEWSKKWQVNGFKSNNKQAIKNQDLWQELLQLPQLKQTEWHWVKGHSGHSGNELADSLAQAMAQYYKTLS